MITVEIHELYIWEFYSEAAEMADALDDKACAEEEGYTARIVEEEEED